jgi:hypothetical protein
VVEVAQPRALLSFSPPLLSLAFAPNRGGHGWLGKEMAAPPWRPSPVHACGRSRARRRRAAPRWCPLGGPCARTQRRWLGCGGALEIRRLCSFSHGVERLPSVVTNTADGRRWWRSRYVPRTFLG